MADNSKGLTDLLRWGIENSTEGKNGAALKDGEVPAANDPTQTQPKAQLNQEALASLFGGPSDADLMRASMEAIQDPEVNLENKLIAFDNFEQLIENLDNANNLSNLSLWTPLLSSLENPEAELRRMAAWCVGTAVQNNVKSQESLLAQGGIPTLAQLAVGDADKGVRRKAIYALSSAVRNYQPALDVLLKELEKHEIKHQGVDAADMDAVDVVIDDMRGANTSQ